MEKKTKNIQVRFTQQQMELLENLRKEGKFGKTYEAVILNIFREYIRQTFGKGGA
jgi:hypothetical protein